MASRILSSLPARPQSGLLPRLRNAFSTSAKASQDPLTEIISSAGNTAKQASAATSTRTQTAQSQPSPEATEGLRSLTRRLVRDRGDISRRNTASRRGLKDSIAQFARAQDLERQQTRRWKQGDVYAPHDLTPAEMQKWRKRTRPTMDAFDALGMNPLDHYKNFAIMSEYMTEMGRIRNSYDTGLRPVNQRRIAKAIRRSIGMGLMPSVHKHPEILEQTWKEGRMRNRPIG
ncbi:ribosomal protein S18 [Xylona heveae TC161]|uniref:Small ribosomal subunit protein bS18m n=1 Tax=Xylona heveae (strain CBS 132557 / TC161) TaxID=1328760 RepID=A0A165A806_XYLHT|nr:ribosomal protein S18 [Xylona heveae TC161]KZF20082.1 ribosomal protein S18 [Xylona heveae TC161]